MNSNKKILFLLVFAFLLLPQFAFAQTTIQSLIRGFGDLVALAIPIALGLALLYFVWGLAIFIRDSSGNPDAKEEGRNKILWGVISLFVIVSIWAIVEFLGTLLGVSQNEEVRIPQLGPEERIPLESRRISEPVELFDGPTR